MKISQFVPETKYLTDHNLTNLVASIISCCEECEDASKQFDSTQEVISSSSASWLEMTLVEILLRNRDRISLLYPSFKAHYIKTTLFQCKVSYRVERYRDRIYFNVFFLS